jgi:hypothetical protein
MANPDVAGLQSMIALSAIMLWLFSEGDSRFWPFKVSGLNRSRSNAA